MVSLNPEDPITLALEIKVLEDKVKMGWSYLSEEIDKWGESFSFNNPRSDESNTYERVRENVRSFDRKYQLAIKVGLGKHPVVSQILERGKDYSDRIKSGHFMRYPSNEQIEDCLDMLDDKFGSQEISH